MGRILSNRQDACSTKNDFILSNRQDACSTKNDLFSATGKMPVPQRMIFLWGGHPARPSKAC